MEMDKDLPIYEILKLESFTLWRYYCENKMPNIWTAWTDNDDDWEQVIPAFSFDDLSHTVEIKIEHMNHEDYEKIKEYSDALEKTKFRNEYHSVRKG